MAQQAIVLNVRRRREKIPAGLVEGQLAQQGDKSEGARGKSKGEEEYLSVSYVEKKKVPTLLRGSNFNISSIY